jgi:hypothetical protein
MTLKGILLLTIVLNREKESIIKKAAYYEIKINEYKRIQKIFEMKQ